MKGGEVVWNSNAPHYFPAFLTRQKASAISAADSSLNRKDNIVSFGIKAGVGWPAVTTPFFIAVPGVFEDWNFGLDYGSKTYTTDSTSSGIKSTGSFTIKDTGLFARYFFGN